MSKASLIFSIIIFILLFNSNTFASDNLDADQELFLKVLGLSENKSEDPFASESEWPLRSYAQSEMANWGTQAPELYEKIKKYLGLITPSLRKLMALKKKVDSGQFHTQTKFLEVGLSCGLICGSTIRLQVGLKRDPKRTYPFLGLQFSVQPPREWISFGAAASIGVGELKLKTKNAKKFMLTLDDPQASVKSIGNHKMASVPVGRYKTQTNTTEGDTYLGHGVAVGIMASQSEASNLTVNLIPQFPIWFNHFETPMAQQISLIMNSLYRFDFEQVESQISLFQTMVNNLEVDLAERGVTIFASDSLPELNGRHALSSPGVLFSPPVIARYAPQMLPAAMIERAQCQGLLTEKTKKADFTPLLQSSAK